MPRSRPKKQEPQTELEKLKVELERARTENTMLKKSYSLSRTKRRSNAQSSKEWKTIEELRQKWYKRAISIRVYKDG